MYANPANNPLERPISAGSEVIISPDGLSMNTAPANAANPVYGMKYMVVGGGDSGFTGKQWAVADSLMLSEILKLVYITKPTVLVSPQDNPLITDYIGYVDFAFGIGDARPIIFSNPA